MGTFVIIKKTCLLKHVYFTYVSAFINIVIYSNVSIISVFPDHTASMEVSTGVGNSCMFKQF